MPVTAVLVHCRMFNLPVDVHMIRLDKGQHKQQEYLSINPLGKVRQLQLAQQSCSPTVEPAWHS